MDDSYSWTAAGSGDWGTPSNWFDVTTGQAAIAAPGSADVVAIDGPSTGAVTVTGPASVLGLAVNGGVTLAGNFAIGSFSLGIPQFFSYSPGTITSNIALTGTVIAQSVALGNFFEAPGDFGPIVHAAVVDIDPAAILSTGTFALTAGELQVDGGGLMTSGLLTLGSIVPFVLGLNGPLAVSGSLDVSNHASVHLDSLVIQDGTIELDATSTLEIGNAGTAAEGTVTVDPGAEVIVGNYFYPNALSVFSGPVLNNGSIIDNGSYNFSDVINNGTIDVRIATLSSISGAGQIIAGGGVTIGPGVSGTVDMEFGGLGLDISLGSGVTVAPTDTPYINDFGAGDSLVVQGVIADRAYYTPTGTAMGTLTLDRDGTPVASHC